MSGVMTMMICCGKHITHTIYKCINVITKLIRKRIMKQSTKRMLKRIIKEEVSRALREEELSPDIIADYERRAEDSDVEVDINMSIPTVSITRDDGEEWFFQEHRADELLDSIPEDIHPETYLKVVAMEW